MALLYLRGTVNHSLTALQMQNAAKQVSALSGVTRVDYLINNAAVSDPGQSRLQYVLHLAT